MVALKGSLSGIGLPAIIRLIGELRRSGRLELTNGHSDGVLVFDNERLGAASLDQQQGLDALAACMQAFSAGEFAFVEGLSAGDHTLDLGKPSRGHVLDVTASVASAPPGAGCAGSALGSMAPIRLSSIASCSSRDGRS